MFTGKIMLKRIFLLLVVVAGLIAVIAIRQDPVNDQAYSEGAHLNIDKAVIVDIPSVNSIVVEIINETEHEKNEYSLSNGEIVSAVFFEDNQRAIDLISTLHVGSIGNLSRYDTTKIQNTTPYMILECTGNDIYDDQGESIIEYY